MIVRRLTGETRYRKHRRCWRPTLLVLQVEECRVDGERVFGCLWRDARPEDLTELSQLFNRRTS